MTVDSLAELRAHLEVLVTPSLQDLVGRPSSVDVELREFSRLDDDLREELSRLSNRLREQLHRFCPDTLALCPAADEPWF
jgi:hypothetical protein